MSSDRPYPASDAKYQEYLSNLFEVRASRRKPVTGKTLIEFEQDHYRLNSSFRYARPVRGLSTKQVMRVAHAFSTPQGRHEKFLRTLKRTPEVMVKISGGGKNTGAINAHLAYIARTDGHAGRERKTAVEIEDEQGHVYQGKEDVAEVMQSWSDGKIGIPRTGEKRREAYNIVLSMPPGTDRAAVKKAARAFAKEQFSNHQYVLAEHTDEKHPHVHLCVKAKDFDGRRMNPRKKDLQEWREVFAEKLRSLGVEANATKRRERGVIKKAQKQVIRRMDARRDAQGNTPSRATMGQARDVAEALAGHVPIRPRNPAADAIRKNRQDTIHAYGQIARWLAQTAEPETRKIALDVMDFVKTMPPPKTRHEEQLEAARRYGGNKFQGGAGEGRAQNQRQGQRGKLDAPDRTGKHEHDR